MSAERRVRELKLDLGPVSAPVANYVNAVRTGNLLYLAGKGPRADASGKRPQGKVGRDYTVDEAYQHARSVGLDLLAVMRDELGSLDRVKRVVKVLGMVNAAPGFPDTPRVVHGASELYYAVFGEAGVHARSAVGLQALPSDVAVEVETIFEIE